mgnify:CR=1 FL=1
MSALQTLKAIRAVAGEPRTTGLSDAVLERLLPDHPELQQAIAAAGPAHEALRAEFPEQVRWDEGRLITWLQADYVNFYAAEAINPYVPLAARGPWIVTAHGAVDSAIEATQLGKCNDLGCTTDAVAELARTCAECHVAGGVGPQPSGVENLPSLPPQKQHAYAAMYMWIGLVTPHERAFEVGLGGAVPPVDLDSPQALFDELQVFEQMVGDAKQMGSWDDRADAFGQMLQTCASCHELAGLDRRIKAEQKLAEKRAKKEKK